MKFTGQGKSKNKINQGLRGIGLWAPTLAGASQGLPLNPDNSKEDKMEMIKGNEYKGILNIGQEVYCGLYGGMYGVIHEIEGEQQPESIKRLGGGVGVMGGNAWIKIAFYDCSNPHFSSTPESIVRGIQWEIGSPETLKTSQEIEEAKEIVKKSIEAKKLSDIEKAQARERRREEIKKNHPELEQVPPNSYKERVIGAKNIKKELSRAFPVVKFSIRGKSFSGGDSIDIDWTDGPTEEMVKKITDKYQEGNFDGMEDIYRHDHENVWPEVFGGAKYVMEQRRDSASLILKTAQNLFPKYELTEADLDKYGSLEGSPKLTREQAQMIYREARTVAA